MDDLKDKLNDLIEKLDLHINNQEDEAMKEILELDKNDVIEYSKKMINKPILIKKIDSKVDAKVDAKINAKVDDKANEDELPKPDNELLMELSSSGMSYEEQKETLETMGFDVSNFMMEQNNAYGGDLVLADGSYYSGELDANGAPHGFGILKDLDEDKIIYEGIWTHGLKNGHGTYYLGNGYHYDGDIENEKLHGKGKYYYSKKLLFEGNYDNGTPTGEGTLYLANGSTYRGNISAKYKGHGKGKLFNKSNVMYYEGDVIETLPHGHGRMLVDYKWYEGEFKNGTMDGVFSCELPDKSLLCMFEKGKMMYIVSENIKLKTKEEIDRENEEIVKSYTKKDFLMIL